MQNVFIIGSKGIPANYGGFETFVDELVSRKKSDNIKYHVSCLADNDEEGEYNGARTFNVSVPDIGPAKAIYYDVKSLLEVLKYIKSNNVDNAIIYILACRIGPFMKGLSNKAHRLGATIVVNPDGHEWKREKWSYPVRRYWKLSEKFMVKHCDELICDSVNIEKYILNEYKKYNPKTDFIAYGADTSKSVVKNDSVELGNYYKKHDIKSFGYYLIVGRFVPENNYQLIIREFLKSNTKKDLVIITNVEENKFYNNLKQATKFHQDNRVKFVGTLYDQELLKKVRENAFAYLHGHEVGGTNPSLLEALAVTNLNILLDVGFNKEVAEDGAMYFTKKDENLANLIDDIDNIPLDEVDEYSEKAKNRIKVFYDWELIVGKYERKFTHLK